jgi:hypothetical protein
VDHLQRQLEESQRRENLLKRRLDGMVEEHQTDGGDGPPHAKKIRVSDMIFADAKASNPQNITQIGPFGAQK